MAHNSKESIIKEVWKQVSTNGRWGVAIVAQEDVQFPAEGHLRYLGTTSGTKTYLFEPGQTQQYVWPTTGEVEIHGGASLVESMSLQSSDCACIVLLGPQAVVERFGYKRRSSRIVAFVEGVETEIPAPVLLAMGLIRSEEGTVEIEPPPPLEGPMAEAFKRLQRA